MLDVGTVVRDNGSLAVNLGGVVIPGCRWAGAYTPLEGDTVYVDRRDGRAIVHPIFTTPPPETGTVTADAVDGTVGVLGDDGVTYRARYFGPAPASGARVGLLWQNQRTPWALTDIAALPTDPLFMPPGPPPPPPVRRSGTIWPAATVSGSGRSFGWAPGEVRQGRYGSGQPYRGAWFYGNQVAQVRGATITRAQFRVPARLRVGNFNASMTLNLYRHTSTNAGADVTRVEGPYPVTVPGGFGGGWIDIPVSWATGLINGGGIAAGSSGGADDYAGFNGINADPMSGQLSISWRR